MISNPAVFVGSVWMYSLEVVDGGSLGWGNRGQGGVDDRRGKSSDTDTYKSTEQERVTQCKCSRESSIY